MLSLSEWVILLLIALLVFHLATQQKPRPRAVRVIEDMRPALPAQAEVSEDRHLEWIALAALALAAIGCMAVMVAVRSGWV